MSKAIREFDGKTLLHNWLTSSGSDLPFSSSPAFAQVTPSTSLEHLPERARWLSSSRLVVKPDQLIKRRGKAGLLLLDATYAEACAWIAERRNQVLAVEQVSGPLTHFLVERFVPHAPEDEYYLAMTCERDQDVILFHHEGGVDVGDVDAKAVRFEIPVLHDAVTAEVLLASPLLAAVPPARREALAAYVAATYQCFRALHFSLLEINPLVMTSERDVVALDMAAKIDEAAKFECSKYWGNLDFPAPFGRVATPEEEYVAELDGRSGASLKLTVLNPAGRIWTMVAGGGASVIYADTIADLGAGKEMANYGEYSGAPSEALTYEYAKVILDLMTRHAREEDKVLIIGGGIANFTNVADTFKGIIRALSEFSDKLREHRVRIYVRRGGPNYQEGLNNMRQLAVDIDLPIVVHGPERHITAVVSLALGMPMHENDPTPPTSAPSSPRVRSQSSSDLLIQRGGSPSPSASPAPGAKSEAGGAWTAAATPSALFRNTTRAIVFGMQRSAVQNMLDFDYICQREKPSVAAVVYPFTSNHYEKFYWNTKEILIPIYQDMSEALEKHPEVDVAVNFASFRSVYDSTSEMLDHSDQLRTIAIIAEGVPERRARQLLARARSLGVTVIGPATVGGLKPGCFRIGNTGGMLDNIIASKLYRPGSVAYVTQSGGMSNELNNIVSRHSDGVYEGVAIGGDAYPGTTFLDHMLRYEEDPNVAMIVLLGEVGGTEEYRVVEAIRSGRISKPVVAWCIGTCADIFPYEVQFGHAGSCATGAEQTAAAKNSALRQAGAYVPVNFNQFGLMIKSVYKRLVRTGRLVPRPEVEPPRIPVDYAWARKLGLIRKPSNFISSISDERGEELTYAGMPISRVLEEGVGVGGVVGLLWFRRKLPEYFCRFIEMVLMVTADHGPAVAGAHNTIVAARAGKDLISSLASGLLTIGPRFGGALDAAAQQFSHAYDSHLTPHEFVNTMRKQRKLIMGIGHKVKSTENPDARVTVVKEFVKSHFKSTELLDFALEVEKITTKKRSNLILNVDGCVAVCFVDMLRSCGAFTREEADEYIEMGTLNGLFVLGRSIGFIGHYLDQKRLKQGLYRHPTEDISYLSGDL